MEQEDRDMLIRIDQKVLNIEQSLSNPDYRTLVEKVRLHSKLIWVVLTVSISTAFKAFWVTK